MSVSPSKLTTADIAEACGVSKSTAAAALRGAPTVKAATRDMVLAMAKKLGYVANNAASILASSRKDKAHRMLQIGILTIDFQGRLTTPSQMPSIRREAAKYGEWMLEPRLVHSPGELTKLTLEWSSRGFDGVVIWRVYPTSASLAFPEVPFSLVGALRDRCMEGVDVVRTSHYFEQLRLLQRVWQRGYRRIGVLWRHHTPEGADDRARLAGILDFQDSVPVKQRVPILRRPFTTNTPVWAEEVSAIGKYIRTHRPEVLVGFNSMDLYATEQTGFEIPRDICVALVSCEENERGRVFGTLCEHGSSVSPILSHLWRKIRAGERGLSDAPVEVVFRCTEHDGPTLPAKR